MFARYAPAGHGGSADEAQGPTPTIRPPTLCAPMFKNALLYRIGPWEPPSSAEIESRLDAGRFVECGASQLESAGWVEPRGEKNGVLMEGVGGQLILKLCIERKA